MDPFPASVQQKLINANINNCLVFVFLMGVYTVVLVWTLYLYWTRKAAARNLVIIITLMGLYTMCLLEMCICWYKIIDAQVTHGETRETIILFAIMGGEDQLVPWSSVLLQYASYILADLSLVWRCNRIYPDHKIALLIPLASFVIEAALFIVIATLSWFIFNESVSLTSELSRGYDIIIGSFDMVVAVTSSITTSLICYRICKQMTNIPFKSRYRYRSIIWLLIDSSFIYTLGVVVLALISFYGAATTGTPQPFEILIAEIYIGSLANITSGLAPTLMVTRIVNMSNPVKGMNAEAEIPSDLHKITQDAV